MLFHSLPIFLLLLLPQLGDLLTEVLVRHRKHKLCGKVAIDFTLVCLHPQLSEEFLLGCFDGVVLLLAVRGSFSDVLG